MEQTNLISACFGRAQSEVNKNISLIWGGLFGELKNSGPQKNMRKYLYKTNKRL